MLIERTSNQFQQSTADYVARCSCGWVRRDAMGRGLLGLHRLSVAAHELECPRAPKGSEQQ